MCSMEAKVFTYTFQFRKLVCAMILDSVQHTEAGPVLDGRASPASELVPEAKWVSVYGSSEQMTAFCTTAAVHLMLIID